MIQIIIIAAIITFIAYKLSRSMKNKKVQRNSNGTVRVYRSSNDYYDYPSFSVYAASNDYSPNDTLHDVSSFEGFSGGDGGGGGASGSYDSGYDSSSDFGGDCGGGDGGGGD